MELLLTYMILVLSYDRRIERPYADQWKTDIQALYDTAKARVSGNATVGLT